jgi:4-hydroxy-3-methylbut-2-enyl diphosphate reductase
VAAQTTQPLARVHYLASLVRQRFPESEVKVVDTVCQPTKQRQSAAMELAAGSDVVIVVGGANSNNTRELAATCRRFCARVWQVQSAAEICASWFEGVRICGLTAGTSTPDDIIDAVEVRLRELAEVELVEMVAVGR